MRYKDWEQEMEKGKSNENQKRTDNNDLKMTAVQKQR